MQARSTKRHEGVVVKKRSDGSTAYMAHVWDAREQKRVRKTFDTLAAAKSWRNDALSQLQKGVAVGGSKLTLRAAADAWLEGAKAGAIRNRSGDVYKPSALRGYEQALRLRILPEIGAVKLTDIRRGDVQRLVDKWQGEGHDASTIRNTLMPLRVLYRYAIARDSGVTQNPTIGLELPAVRGKRDRIASPTEGAALLEAVPTSERALWATAMYAGLRLGELLALDWKHVDLAAGVIRVERSFDPKAGFVEPKSRAGKRAVPIAAVLRDHLIEHRMRQGREFGLAFGRTPEQPFQAQTSYDRARKAWKEAKLDPIGLHECRHTFASLMIAAGVNAKVLSTFMGHATVAITLDRYGKLFPGAENDAADLLNAYLASALDRDTEAARAAVAA